MTREELDQMWSKATEEAIAAGEQFTRYRFAALVAAAKEQQMIADGWRHCAKGQRTTQFCGLTEQAITAEREACAQVCLEEAPSLDGQLCAEAIRARGGE